MTLNQALEKANEAYKNGDFDAATRLYERIIQIEPNHPDANHNMGSILADIGDLEKALSFFKTALESNFSFAHFWFSYINALYRAGRYNESMSLLTIARTKGCKGKAFDDLEEKLNSFEIKLEIKIEQLMELVSQGETATVLEASEHLLKVIPNSLNLLSVVSLANQKARNFDAAVENYKHILNIMPDNAEAYNNMGNIFKTQGKLEDAINAYTKAIALRPNFFMAFYNMGTVLKEQGKLEKAIKAYQNVLAIKADFVQAFNNIGNIFRLQGKLDEAIEFYNKGLAIKPDYVEIYCNLGVAFKEQDKPEEAIDAYCKALTINPNFNHAKNNLCNILKYVIFTKSDPRLQRIITSLLDNKLLVRPDEVGRAVISLLKFEPKLKRHLEISSFDDLEEKAFLVIQDLSELSLLLKFMTICPIPDVDIENLLRNLRGSLLLSIADSTKSSGELEFQSALALQCFTNDYIYKKSENEVKYLSELEAAVEQILRGGGQPSPQAVLCLASYRPLNQYKWSSSLLVTNEIEKVFKTQVVEPSQEFECRNNLVVLEDILDDVSVKVRGQYEVSPYPKWVNLGLSFEAGSISKMVDELNLKLCADNIKNVGSPNILVAGCGTGQHSILTAARFKNSNVLAIDLSLSSLSYAKRKTKELGVANVEYMQADILNLDKLNEKFDIVESVGVLHHMNEPLAGWRVLTECLKPNGLMRLGLYSQLARQHIVKMREEINISGIGSSDDAIRSFREMVIKSDKSHHKKIKSSSDFYSLSTVKDLLFHVQEHRFTIPLIQDCLSKLGLKFCGFEGDQIVSHFKLSNAGEDDHYDLDKWQTYEELNPRAFGLMYQFWCQKIA